MLLALQRLIGINAMKPPSRNVLSTIEEVIADAKGGKLLILVDDELEKKKCRECVVENECKSDDFLKMCKEKFYSVIKPDK